MPSHHNYIFLGEHNILLVIISADLTKIQKEAFLLVLKVYREAKD